MLLASASVPELMSKVESQPPWPEAHGSLPSALAISLITWVVSISFQI